MINLYKEYAIGVKKLSDAELSRESSPSGQTHIGLSEKVLTFLPNTPEQREGILIYNKSCSMVECAFSKIGNVRSTKIDTSTTNPVKSIVKQIRNIASNDALDWFLVWFALDYQVPVFWLFNSNSAEYKDFSKIIDLSKQTTVYKEKSSDDEYFKILMLIRSLNKLDQLVTKKYFDAKENLLLAASSEHRTFVHLALDYFRGANHLDPLLEYFSTQESDTPICVTDNNKFKLSNMFINTDEQEIASRNAGHSKRWYTDPFRIAGKDYYLYVDWYPGPDKNGNDVQLMIPHFIELIHACYGLKYEYRNSQGTHELWLVNTPSLMIANASDKFSLILKKYREELPLYWKDEMYKWEAVKQFQSKWDIDAEDFSAMFTDATSKHYNLLASNMYYPIGMIQSFAAFDKERTREMFRVLFDESKDLTERIKYFWDESDDMREKGDEKWYNHYQDLHAVSTYLTFMYPEKYFIYKYTELRNCIKALGDEFSFPGKTPPDFYSKVVDYCEGLRSRIAADKATCDALDKQISNNSSCYEDKHRNVATVDFIYYVGKRLKDIPTEEPTIIDEGPVVEPDENSRYWIYAPGEGASMWELCQEKGIMVLGWSKIGDYRQYESHEQLVSDMQDIYNKHDKNFMHSSLAVWQFLHDLKVGDVIFVKQGLSKIIGRGVVQGDYEYDAELDERFPNKRRVHWTHVGVWDSPVGLPRKTLTRFYENSTSIFMLERLFFPDLKPAIEPIPFSMDKLIKHIDETGLIYTPALIKRFAFSLMTKPFVILSGLAGSGKTQLAITFAKALVEDAGTQLCTVSVGADWTNREPLLGFPNALQPNQYVRPESRVLDLMIEANKPENANKPYFLILDEMNMSYVERYFADFLSAMESKEAIPLWNGCLDPNSEDDDSDDTPTSIKLPSNLFIIGTINVDETTYMFSPKVLDRANVIEFKISADEMSSFLENMKDVNPDNIISKAANMAANFVEIASKNDLKKEPAAIETLKKFFGELKNVNAEFGYRSATEIFRFICQAKNNDDTANKITDDEILDAAIVQKLLPKLHGSRKKLDPVLKQLWKLCFKKADSESEMGISSDRLPKAVFKESADKIWRMYESASANGFTSFAEA